RLHPPVRAEADRSAEDREAEAILATYPNCKAFRAPMGGTLVALHVSDGTTLRVGQAIGVIEAMKMENVISATWSGQVEKILARTGDSVQSGDILLLVSPSDTDTGEAQDTSVSTNSSRTLVEDLLDRKRALLDESRTEAMAKLKKRGSLSA